MASISNLDLLISSLEMQDVMSDSHSESLEYSNNIHQELYNSSSETTTKLFLSSSQMHANFIKSTQYDRASKSFNENLHAAPSFSKEAPNKVGENSTEIQGISSGKNFEDVHHSEKRNSTQLGLFEVNESTEIIHPALSKENEASKTIHPTRSRETESSKLIHSVLSETTESSKEIQPSLSVETESTKVIQPYLSEETESSKVIQPFLSEETESSKVIHLPLSEETEFPKVILLSLSEETESAEVIKPSLSIETELNKVIQPSLSIEIESAKVIQTSLSENTKSTKAIEPALVEQKVPTPEILPVYSEEAKSTQVKQLDISEDFNLNKITTLDSLEPGCCKEHISSSDFESYESHEKSYLLSESANNIPEARLRESTKLPNDLATECFYSPEDTDNIENEKYLAFPNDHGILPQLSAEETIMSTEDPSEIWRTQFFTLLTMFADWVTECYKNILQHSNSRDLIDYLTETFIYGKDLLRDMNVLLSTLITEVYSLQEPTSVLPNEPTNVIISNLDSLLSAGLQVQWRLIALEDEIFQECSNILSDYEEYTAKPYLLTREAIEVFHKIVEDFKKLCGDVEKFRERLHDFYLEIKRLL